MRITKYSTTSNFTEHKPVCFESPGDTSQVVIKLPDSQLKVDEGGLRLDGLFKTDLEKKPLVTIITVVYNGEEFLEETILSVLGQTYDNIEYVIVDGGSSDRTLDIIKRYEHAIDYWVSEPDEGIFNAMNKGIALASGSWLNFMNAGDKFCSPMSLSKISIESLGDHEVIYGDKIQNGSIIKSLPIHVLKCGVIHACHQSMLFHKTVETMDLLKYEERYSVYADYDLVAKLYKNGLSFFYHEAPVSVFQGGGVSSVVSKEKRIDKYTSVYFNFGVIGVIRSILYRLRGVL